MGFDSELGLGNIAGAGDMHPSCLYTERKPSYNVGRCVNSLDLICTLLPGFEQVRPHVEAWGSLRILQVTCARRDSLGLENENGCRRVLDVLDEVEPQSRHFV